MRPLPVSNTQVFTLAERAFFTITSSFLNHLNSSFVVFFFNSGVYRVGGYSLSGAYQVS